MNYPVTGLHHVTSCAGDPQEDVDFLTQVVGLRMIKQTILFDGKKAFYHLYYSNANAEPGSVFTTFPYEPIHGRKGSGQIKSTTYTVGKNSLPFWKEHFDKHKTTHDGIEERFGQKFIRFDHPCGLSFEMLEDPADNRVPWTTSEIGKGEAVRGFYGVVMSVREIEEEERFFIEALGFRKTGAEGPFHRFEIGAGGANRTLILKHEPDLRQGSWTFGVGTNHHVALNVPNDDLLAEQKGWYEGLGYTDCSEIKDRNYFHSIYCRSPGGILVECAATVPQGFAKDEPADKLGHQLLLPPWFENRRAEVEAMLPKIRVPQGN